MSGWKAVLLWDLSLQQWLQTSFLGRLTGILAPWSQSSWLIRWLDPLCLGMASLYLVFSAQAETGRLGLILLGMAALLGLHWLTRPPALTPIHLPLGLYWGIATVATFLSPVPHAALQGWIKLSLYLLGFLLLHQLLRTPPYRSLLTGVLLLVSLWMGVYGLRQYFYGAEELATWVDPESGLSGVTRVYSYLRNPNLYGGFLVPVIPIGLAAAWYWRSWGWKVLALFITGINLLCLLLTYSRGAWLGEVVALASIALLSLQWINRDLPRRWRRWTIPAFLAASAAVLLLGLITVEPLRLRVFSMFAGRNDTSNNFRINVWMAALDMIRDFPVLGIGPGNDAFNRVYPLYQNPNFTALGAYSVPLELAIEAGIPGLLVYLWLLVLLGVRGWCRWCEGLQARPPEALWVAAGLAGVLGMMVHGLVDTVWYRPQVQMLWWIAVALITSSLDPEEAAPSPSVSMGEA
jgi:putative inorganic carbon (HCO3(-)) transporter